MVSRDFEIRNGHFVLADHRIRENFLSYLLSVYPVDFSCQNIRRFYEIPRTLPDLYLTRSNVAVAWILSAARLTGSRSELANYKRNYCRWSLEPYCLRLSFVFPDSFSCDVFGNTREPGYSRRIDFIIANIGPTKVRIPASMIRT